MNERQRRSRMRRAIGRGWLQHAQAKMNKEQIAAMFDRFDEAEPGASTERLMEMTAQACDCAVADVAEALFKPNDPPTRTPI